MAGQITNPSSDSAWVRIEPEIGRDFTSFGARLDDNNSFVIHFDIDEPLPVTFYDGKETSQMFVQPGDSIYLTLDTKEFDETIKYSGTGADRNNYLAQKYLKFDDGSEYSIWDMIDSLSPAQYKTLIDKKRTSREQMVKDYTSGHNESSDFKSFEETNIDFEYAFDLFMYIRGNRDYKSGYDTINVPVSFYELFGSFADYNNPYTKSKSYNIYYNFYYPQYLTIVNSDMLKGKEGAERDSIILAIYKANLDGFEKERAITNYFYGKISRYNIDYFEENKDFFDENVTNKKLREYVYNEYDKVKKQLSQDMPEGAKLVNLERKEYSKLTFTDVIGKYKGKVIYLDFWASWCGPCKGEMPSSLEMQDYFKGKDVAFVYFSSDKDSVAWEQMIKILQISGDHYRVNKKIYKEYNKLYNVRYIPRYMIIDKNGKTVDDKAKRPSDLTVRQDIEELLK